MGQLASGFFSAEDPGLFQPILDSLLNGDPYLVLADYASYIDCQQRVSAAYQDRDGWTKKAIANVAKSGKFSSDRAVAEYAKAIWGASPLYSPSRLQRRLQILPAEAVCTGLTKKLPSRRTCESRHSPSN